MKLSIKNPIPIPYRPNVSEWVKLNVITRDQLCHQTNNPTAYLRQNGPDALSLKVTSPNQNENLLMIKYDADKKVATVFINWSLYEMHQAVQKLLVCISGNHNVDIEVTMQVVHPKKVPNIQLVNKTTSCVWGTTDIANLVVRGTIDGGHDTWKYTYLTKVFIEKVDGFYIPDQRVESYDGKNGYIINLKQWEQKSIVIKYDYARGYINKDIQRKLPVYYIYYSINRTGRQSVNRQVIDEFVVSFTPLRPTIAIKMNRLQKEYVIGTKDVNLFEVTLTKQDGHAQNLEDLNLISQDSRIKINKVNDSSYLVSIKAHSFKDLPSSNVQVKLKASARNANSVSEYLVLTTGHLDDERSVLLKKEKLIDIDSEIRNHGSIILYKGNSSSQYLLYLRNISSSVLGTSLILNNIKLEIKSDLGVSFCNGRTRENIASLQGGAFSILRININPDSICSIKDVSIVATSEYSEPLSFTVKVKTLEKIQPQIRFDFEKEEDIYTVEPDYFEPIKYNNQRIGTLSIQTEKISKDLVNNYVPYSFKDHPIEILDNEKISIESTLPKTILQPNDKMEIGVFLNGVVSSGEYFIIKSACNEEKITLPVSPKKYNLPYNIEFCSANDDYTFEYCEKEILYIGEFIPKFQEQEDTEEVDCVMGVSKPFCFENGSCEISITKTSSPVKLYFLLSEEFGNVRNISNNKSFQLILSLFSHVFHEKQELNYGDIIITSIVAKASPFVELRFEQKQDENKRVAVNYSDVWFTDSKNMICELVLRNNTSLPYSPNEDCKNDYVKYTDICIEDEDGFILFGNPGEIVIENGQHEVVLPVYIDCEKWQGQKKEIKISCGIKICTSNTSVDIGDYYYDDYYIEFIEQRNDKIFSLDLGTTGIVMAKQEDFEISTIELQDAEEDNPDYNIEKNVDIISSITIVNNDALSKEAEIECHQILISPRNLDYKNNAKFIFVPAKFMVGQKRIPYIGRCLHDIPFVAFDPSLTTWGDDVSDECFYTLDANEDGYYLTPEIFIQLTYENILNRCNEREKIKKLIITYPNTYTNNVLDELRNLVSMKLDNLSGFVDMVPESDAVVAFYFNERINYYGDDQKTIEERKVKAGTEKILIYDMGAGTLDLSLVTITRNPNTNRVSAEIEKKIGIPIAGNYLDWVLYDSFFKDKLKDGEDKTLKNLKDYIKYIKQQYTSEGLKNQLPVEGAHECLDNNYADALAASADAQKASADQKDVILTFDMIDGSIEDYIKVCSETILTVFLGEEFKVDRLVYSGRGSQFGPLRTAIENFLEKNNSNLIIDKTIENNDLKTCVAKGALCYNDLFGVDSDHVITNRNQHLNLGVVYIAPAQDGSTNEIHYKEIIHPDDGSWADATLIDGTWWRHFDNTVYIDLSVKNKKVYFIQTLLGEEEIIKLYRKVYSNSNTMRTELDWVFINELFSFNTNTLTQHNRDNIAVNISIDEENNINYSVGGRFPRGEKLVDRIENNIFYQRGMWPYVNFENK